MSIKITEAVYRKDGVKISVLTPEDMDKAQYETIYKDHLYCPHPGCTALISYAEGNIQINHFRSYRGTRGKHIPGCPYVISYEGSSGPRRKYDPDYRYRISDDHISEVLRRAYLHFVEGKKKPNTGSTSGSQNPQPGKGEENLTLQGEGELFSDLEEKSEGREQNIYSKLIDELDASDHQKKLCVVGKVSNVYIKEGTDEGYVYINYITRFKNGQRIESNVCFAKRFIAMNEVQFGYMPSVREYIQEMKSNGLDVYCCCVGEVKKNESGSFSILPDRYTAFSINNKKLYAIIHELNPNL